MPFSIYFKGIVNIKDSGKMMIARMPFCIVNLKDSGKMMIVRMPFCIYIF